ncbi:hypothetical protein BC830DRAFT_592815 [Chytriomyces sp. MP71]|nr:hypothetical protein BC830DRAFT_592815 [Chytriomyces sp. MP71]
MGFKNNMIVNPERGTGTCARGLCLNDVMQGKNLCEDHQKELDERNRKVSSNPQFNTKYSQEEECASPSLPMPIQNLLLCRLRHFLLSSHANSSLDNYCINGNPYYYQKICESLARRRNCDSASVTLVEWLTGLGSVELCKIIREAAVAIVVDDDFVVWDTK